MRLFRLDLTRYGRFTDQSIDFGSTEPGGPDLHVIYGPNEAGKSTSLAAFLDLLFGIEPKSSYGFLHPYTTMQIGAALETDGAVREVIRVKRNANSLLDRNGQVLAPQMLFGELGSIDREAYRMMFSLDDDTLESGGKLILSSKGDLGQLLFSASSGLADLSQTLAKLQEDAEQFHKANSRGRALQALKAALLKLKEERETIDVLASHHAQLSERKSTAAAQYDKAIEERRGLQGRSDAIQRLQAALPRLAALHKLREAMSPLAGLGEAPRHWAADLPGLQRQEVELATKREGAAAAVLRLSRALADCPADAAALALADRIDRLTGPRARHMTADKDLPDRYLRLRDHDRDIAALLRRLGRGAEDNPAALLLGAATVGSLHQMMEQRSGVEAGLKAAANEWAEAEQHLSEARAAAEASGLTAGLGEHERQARLGGLAAVVKALRGDDSAVRRRAAERQARELDDRLAGALQLLRPWLGAVTELEPMTVPARADIEAWKAAQAKLLAEIERRRDEVERLDGEAQRFAAEAAAIGSGTGIVDDRQAALIRKAREAAWAAHRRDLASASADAFEARMREDDLAATARFAHAQDVARLHQLARAGALAKAEHMAERQRLEAAADQAARLAATVAAAIGAMAPALPADLPLARLEAWVAQRDKVLDLARQRRAAEGDRAAAEADGAAARRRLAEALAEAGAAVDPAATIDALLTQAQALLDQGAKRQGLAEKLAERQAETARRRRALERATEAEQDWTAAWRALCAGCWLGRDGPPPTPAEAREILRLVHELGGALKARFELADRIRKMENDQAGFAEAVTALAAELGLATEGVAPERLDAAIGARLAVARAAETRRREIRKELDDAEAARMALDQAITLNDRRIATMTVHFGVSSLAEVEAALRHLDRRATLTQQAAEAEADIVTILRVATLEAAEALLEAADQAALDAEGAEVKGRLDDSDQRSRELFNAKSKAEEALEAVGGDAEVARIEERRRTLLLEIEEGAVRYLRLKAGIMAAEQALRLYRDRHRSAMLEQASKAFRTISRGAYKGLTAQPEKDSEILIGLGADGRSRAAGEMSKGTRFQLYLALRVAAYHEFARARPSVPFIADDIMETFDDFRAEEAFRLFADMAAVGQVIYLTHHRHLCEIGRRVCPALKVHELPATVLS